MGGSGDEELNAAAAAGRGAGGVGRSAGVDKVLRKLERSMAEGNYYEAQQMYKTVYARYQAQGKWDDVYTLLQEGARIQLRHKQASAGFVYASVNEGVELGVLLVEAYTKANASVDDETIGRIQTIFEAFPRRESGAGTAASTVQASSRYLDAPTPELLTTGCSRFMRAAIQWTVSAGVAGGLPEFHAMLAEYLQTQSPQVDLFQVSRHYARSDEAEAFGDVLLTAAQHGDPCETDLFIARGVLQMLAAGRVDSARRLLDHYEARSSMPSLLDTPLIHFVQYLLIAALQRHYQPSLKRDPMLGQLMAEILRVQFDVQSGEGLSGMLGNIMQMFSDDA
eukprot:jgi/Chlat1/6878/Chrsp51S00514